MTNLNKTKSEKLTEINNKLTTLLELLRSNNLHQEKWLTDKQAQKYLKVSRSKLYEYRKAGTISATSLEGKILYDREELDKILIENKSEV